MILPFPPLMRATILPLKSYAKPSPSLLPPLSLSAIHPSSPLSAVETYASACNLLIHNLEGCTISSEARAHNGRARRPYPVCTSRTDWPSWAHSTLWNNCIFVGSATWKSTLKITIAALPDAVDERNNHHRHNWTIAGYSYRRWPKFAYSPLGKV